MTAAERGGATVGVALPVPAPWGEQLRQARQEFGEERAVGIPTHITLLGPTPVTAGQLTRLEEHLTCVAARHPAFEVVLRGTGSFRPVSEVVYVQVAQGVSSCELLEQDVRRGPVDPPRAFPYHPHVTVAQELPPEVLDRAFAELAEFSCRFTADQVTLYVHDDGVAAGTGPADGPGGQAWRSYRRYELTGSSPPVELLPRG
ncbi:2'-5' RNA ligase family protein [Ornithinicoccus halotolerans]|uniref:2'-5' RNA ligase family protein n=1 Tax=Ornithinicoccus halotolerans TaxID=1748220 RepID=UPI00129802B2|nr:2'-5' RNA ligase family protein [Ornithinicoccus halotolerans]